MDDCKNTVLEEYKSILDGSRKSFSRGVWSGDKGLTNIKLCVTYLLEEYLNLSEDDIKKQMSKEFLLRYKLINMYNLNFSSIFDLMNEVYPHKYKQWDFRMVPRGFWRIKSNRVLAIKWLIEDKLKYTPDDIRCKLSMYQFEENRLADMFRCYYNGNVYKVLEDAYPGEYQVGDLVRAKPPRLIYSRKAC